MERLPPEVIERVLINLSPLDRVNSALTCKLWAEVMRWSPLLEDIWLDIRGSELDLFEAVFITSDRQYRNLRLSKAQLQGYTPDLWTRVGANLRTLELRECQMSPEVFYGILQKCVRLEALRIFSCGGQHPITALRLPDGISPEEIRTSLANVRHLHLDSGSTGKVLAHVLDVLPNVGSVSLTVTAQRADPVELILSSLGRNRAITELELQSSIDGHAYIVQLLEACAPSLRQLHCYDFTATGGILEAVGKCSRLRRLKIGEKFADPVQLNDELLAMILSSLTELETLELERCESLSILGEISALELLDLRCARLDAAALQSIARLPNLRTLNVEYLSSEGYEVIFENFSDLEELEISINDNLTNETAMKIRNFKKLKSLTMYGHSGLSDLFFKDGLISPALVSLSLGQSSLTDLALSRIAANHSRLRALDLIECCDITEAGVLTLLRRNPLLKTFGILGCGRDDQQMTENVLKALEEFCPKLRVLIFDGEFNATRISIESFKARQPRVKVSELP